MRARLARSAKALVAFLVRRRSPPGSQFWKHPKKKGQAKHKAHPRPCRRSRRGLGAAARGALPPSRMVNRTLVEFDGLAPLPGFQAPPNRSEEETERRPRREDAKHCDHFHQSLLSCSVRAITPRSVRPRVAPRLSTRLDGTWVGPGQLMKHQLPPTSKCCTYLPSSAAGCGMRLGSGAEWQTERLASGMMWYCPEHSSPSSSVQPELRFPAAAQVLHS